MFCPRCHTQNESGARVCSSCGNSLLTIDSIGKGSVVAGRYEIQQPLGKGGMGMVFKAHDQVLDETVALKVLRSDMADDPDLARRFRLEIKLARKVRHRNVCGIHEYGEEGGLRFIAMEYIEGIDLRHILQKSGPPLPEEAFEISMQVCEGLQAIHDAGIIHRDLKTANIMRDAVGYVRLMDFGIAKRAGSEGATLSGTAIGMIVGTPEYMSPEQAKGEKVDFRSDVYALGIVVFEVFTGRVPFHAETPLATLLKQLNEPPPLTDDRIPPPLLAVLEKSLAKDREMRYASATEVFEALRAAREQMFPSAPRASPTLRRSRGGGALPEAVPETSLTPVPTDVRTAIKTQVTPTEPARRSERVEAERKRAESERARALANVSSTIEKLLGEGRFDEAERTLGRALGLHGESEALSALAARVEVARAEGRKEAAARDIASARELVASGRLTEADEALQRVDLNQPGLESFGAELQSIRAALEAARREGEERAARLADLLSQAESRLASHSHREALVLLDEAASLDPGSAAPLRARAEASERSLQSLLARAGTSLSAGRLEEAKKGVAEVRRLYGDIEEVAGLEQRLEVSTARSRTEASGRLVARAREALSRGRSREAEQTLKEAQGLDPNHPDLPSLAEAVARARKAEEAAREEADSRRKAVDESLRQAEDSLSKNDPQQAVSALDEVERLEPGNRRTAALRKRAEDMERRGEEEARKGALEPLLAEARHLLETKKPAQALEVLRKAREVDPQDKQIARLAERAQAEAKELAQSEAVDQARAQISGLLDAGSFREAGDALARAERLHPRAEPLRQLRKRLEAQTGGAKKTSMGPLVLVGGATVVVIVGLGTVLFLRHPSPSLSPAPPPSTSLAPSPSVVPSTPAPPSPSPSEAPVAGTGTVVVDALPWGEVIEVRDQAGKAQPLGPARFTPLVLSLPPGEYTIVLRNPRVAAPAKLVVKVKSSQIEALIKDFGKGDARAYLKGVGL